MRPTGTAGELAVRRRIAGRLLLQGTGIRKVARVVGASSSSVKRWKDALVEGGLEALRPKPSAGRERQALSTVRPGAAANAIHRELPIVSMKSAP